MDTLFGFSFSKLIKLAKKKRQRERKLNQTPRRIRLGLSENLSKEAKDLIVHEGRVALVNLKELFGSYISEEKEKRRKRRFWRVEMLTPSVTYCLQAMFSEEQEQEPTDHSELVTYLKRQWSEVQTAEKLAEEDGLGEDLASLDKNYSKNKKVPTENIEIFAGFKLIY